MTLLEAARQALEAFVEIAETRKPRGTYGDLIDTLRAAIEQAEKQDDEVSYWKQMHTQDVNTLKEELREAEKAQGFCYACGIELSEQPDPAPAVPVNQEPVAWYSPTSHAGAGGIWPYKTSEDDVPLFAHPAPAVPEGWKLVPTEPTEAMLSTPYGSTCVSGYKAMVAAAPEVKP